MFAATRVVLVATSSVVPQRLAQAHAALKWFSYRQAGSLYRASVDGIG